MRIAVTGGMGFIGTEIVRQALDRGLEVICVDFMGDLIRRYEKAKLPILKDIYANLSRCEYIVEPWSFADNVGRFSPQVIIHAGAVVDTLDLGSPDLFALNVNYTERLVGGASMTGAHVVFLSSAATYGAYGCGHPLNPYGLTKTIGERIVGRSKTRTSILRLFNVFGRNEHHKGPMASVPFQLARAYETGARFEMHSPDASRDFVPVTTVADVAISRALELLGPNLTGLEHQTFDVGTGRSTTFEELDNFVMQATGNWTSITKIVPMPAHLEGRYQGYTRAGDHGVTVLGSDVTTRDGLEHMYGKR